MMRLLDFMEGLKWDTPSGITEMALGKWTSSNSSISYWKIKMEQR